MGQRADEVDRAKRRTGKDAPRSDALTDGADAAAPPGQDYAPPPIDDDDIEGTRAQIEQTREQMAATIEAIQDNLDPQNLKARAAETVRAATIGRVEELKGTTSGKVQESLNTVGDKAHGAKSTLTNRAQATGSVLGDKVQEAQRSMSSAASTLGDKTTTMTTGVRERLQANGARLVQMVKRNPLPVALLVGSGLILLLYRPRDQQRSRGIATETPPL